MNSNEISAISIGLSIFAIVTLFLLSVGRYKNMTFFTDDTVFYVKKWFYILFVVSLNAAMCTLVYYVQDLQVIVYVILVLKSKDLLSSIIFAFNMFYKHLFTDLSVPKNNLSDEIKRIVAFVPVYKETFEQLAKTVDSILNSNVTPNYLLTCIVSDGNSNSKDIFDKIVISKTDLYYKNWKGQNVSVKLFYGTRNDKHIVLIEKDQNFGKKDSIILTNSIFNKSSHHTNTFTTYFKQEILLDLLSVFGMNEFDYMFATDADTIIDSHTITCLLDSINKRNAMASCGIVNADKSSSNWFWNNLQNFQYLYGQFTRRTTEDLFGQVLCLPGCISMFRLNSKTIDAQNLYSQIPDKDDLIVSSVQYVGTDRRYTGSLLYTNSDAKIVMDTRCNAYTATPQSIHQYTSQRRRWSQNTYFNTMINIVAPNINLILRVFSLIDYLRLTLVYFRLFNTAYFIYLLASQFHSTAILDLVPYLVVLIYPTVFFFVYCLFNKHLRTQWFSLFLFYLLNKVFILLSNIVIFSIMLLNIGCDSWTQTNTTEMTDIVVS